MLALETMHNLTPLWLGYNLWVCAGWQPLTWMGGYRNAGEIG